MKANPAEKLVKISSVINEIYGDDLHEKRQLSIAHSAMGLLARESLFLHRLAEGLVDTKGVNKKGSVANNFKNIKTTDLGRILRPVSPALTL